MGHPSWHGSVRVGNFAAGDHPLKDCGFDDSCMVYREFDDERTENFRDRLVYRGTMINEERFWYSKSPQLPEFVPLPGR